MAMFVTFKPNKSCASFSKGNAARNDPVTDGTL